LVGDLEGGPTTPWVLGTSQSPWEPILQALHLIKPSHSCANATSSSDTPRASLPNLCYTEVETQAVGVGFCNDGRTRAAVVTAATLTTIDGTGVFTYMNGGFLW